MTEHHDDRSKKEAEKSCGRLAMNVRRVILANSYAAGMGSINVIGVLVAALVEDGSFNKDYLLMVAPVHWGVCLIPEAFVNWASRRLALPIWLMVLLASLLQALALTWSSFASTGWELLLSNGIMSGVANCLFVINGLHGVYTLFPTEQAPLSLTILSCGGALGITIVASLYILEAVLGWRWVQRMQAIWMVLTGASAVYLHQAFSNQSSENHPTNPQDPEETSDKQACTTETEHEGKYGDKQDTLEKQHEERSFDCVSLLKIFKNARFNLALTASMLCLSSVLCAQILQPLRMVHFGHKLEFAASAYAVYGVVKCIIMATSGFFITKQIISASRQLQVTSFLFLVFTAASIYLKDIWTQSIYVYHMGFVDAVVSLAAFILIGQSCERGLESLGCTIYFSGSGIVIVVGSIGLSELLHFTSYVVIFWVIIFVTATGIAFSVVYDLITRAKINSTKIVEISDSEEL